MNRYARLTLLLLLTVLTLGLAACGGDDEEAATTPTGAETGDGGGGGGGTVQITTSEGISYDETTVEATAGEVTIEYTNDSGLPHDVTLEDSGEATDIIESGSTSVTVNLEPGEYTFFCSVDGHRDAGMEGTLVVD